MTRYIWENQEPDKHFWAFYYYCKKQGDKCFLYDNDDGTKNLEIIYK